MDRPNERQSRSWVANAAAWTEAVRSGSIVSRRLATDDAVLRAALERRPRRALDVGCGEGWLARALAERGVEVLGIDASAPLLEDARRAGGATYQLCSYDELIAEPARFGTGYDLVVFNFSLLDEALEPLLRAVRSLLAPGGALLIQTVHPWSARGDGPYADGWRTERFASFGGAFAEPMPWYYRTLESWTALLRRAGFELDALREPAAPEGGEPLSLVLVATARG